MLWDSRPFLTQIACDSSILYFKQQTEQFFAHRSHLPEWEELGEFHGLVEHMRDAAVTYLALHGCPEVEARELAKGDLMVWASVHRAGSCHPPHVHSDSMVTGTYYVREPRATILMTHPRSQRF